MMADHTSAEHRNWNMSRIRGEGTKPELVLRSLMRRAGFRYRLHDKKLPGKPDLVLPNHKTAIFVNGCYWHRHQGCPKATTPKTNTAFWTKKFEETVELDARKKSELIESGWRVITVWKCELANDPVSLVEDLRSQLKGGRDG